MEASRGGKFIVDREFEPTVAIGYGDVSVGEILLKSISDVEAVGTVGEGDGNRGGAVVADVSTER